MSDDVETPPFSAPEWESCLKVLRAVREMPDSAVERREFEALISRLYKSARKQRRKTSEKAARQFDRKLVEETGRVRLETPASSRTIAAPLTQVAAHVSKPRHCYVCKNHYTALHGFYHQLCPDWARLNFEKRHVRADLSGRRAVVTGGRIKIGFQTALKLLRDGAEVHVTTRFPKDAACRYSREPDFNHWCSRLRIHAIDLCQLPTILRFIDQFSRSVDALDILINNAAQTIRRPPGFHAQSKELESTPISALPDAMKQVLANGESVAEHASLKIDSLAPISQSDIDRHGQPGDLRPVNSWTLKADEVGAGEVLEVFFVNAIGPYLLNTGLKPLLLKSPHQDRYIVNVSAMEGQFARHGKTSFHPHTNMAKAALNMMTRTSAAEFAQTGIYMNSVDTGWITDENPHPKKERLREQGFVPPLDEIDGAARIYDPIVRGIRGEPVSGLFLKDYVPAAW